MIGFVVEDEALKAIAGEVSKKLGLSIKRGYIRCMDGDRLNKGLKYARDLIRLGCKKVIVLKDKGGAPADVEGRFEQMNFPPQSKLVLAVMEAETWFLADEKALEAYLGAKVKPIPNPEGDPDPKARINRIFKDVKGRSYYESGRDPLELARRVRPEVIEKRCLSFKKFIKALQE